MATHSSADPPAFCTGISRYPSYPAQFYAETPPGSGKATTHPRPASSTWTKSSAARPPSVPAPPRTPQPRPPAAACAPQALLVQNLSMASREPRSRPRPPSTGFPRRHRRGTPPLTWSPPGERSYIACATSAQLLIEPPVHQRNGWGPRVGAWPAEAAAKPPGHRGHYSQSHPRCSLWVERRHIASHARYHRDACRLCTQAPREWGHARTGTATNVQNEPNSRTRRSWRSLRSRRWERNSRVLPAAS
mmetsp:Transcript_9859/g.26840  ORF Transcript_9859/g.26840 Transcript_9859/m.26840 type:complete len:247 (-) Transcript_9859:69-809(-)